MHGYTNNKNDFLLIISTYTVKDATVHTPYREVMYVYITARSSNRYSGKETLRSAFSV
jgi:hypothetical protein